MSAVSNIIGTILTTIAAGGAVFAAIIGLLTYREARRQANASERQTPRAWVYVDPSYHPVSTQPLPNDGTQKEFRLLLNYTLFNHGQVPAQIKNIESFALFPRRVETEFNQPLDPFPENKEYIRSKGSISDFDKKIISASNKSMGEANLYFYATWRGSTPILSKPLFVFIITYDDSNGSDRVTCYYAEIGPFGQKLINGSACNYQK